MTDYDFSEDDLLVEIFISQAEGHAGSDQAPIRVTHKPTGIRAIGENQGSQIKNNAKAIELLKELLAKEK